MMTRTPLTNRHASHVVPFGYRSSSPLQQDTRPVHNMAGKITQIIMADQDEYNFQLLMPLLAQLSRDDRWFAWIAPPLKLPKQWLLEAGIDINKIMMLQPSGNNDTLELARKALTTGTCHAVISWPGQLNTEELEQLELAARKGQSHAILIQPR